MDVFFLLPLLLFLALVVFWSWRRTRASIGSDPAALPGEKPKFETTMGDLRDMRQALRPLQKDQSRR